MDVPGPDDHSDGFALLCDVDGTIHDIVRDDLRIVGDALVGMALPELVHADSRAKATTWLMMVRTQQAVAGWELNVPVGQLLVPFQFAGATMGQRLLVVAATTRHGVGRIYQRLSEGAPEPLRTLCAVLQPALARERRQIDREPLLYEELTRLTNEAVTIQRELVKKNRQLEQLNEEKNQLLGMAAHDLRSPLGAIAIYSQLLLDSADAVLTSTQRACLMTIQERSEFMFRLIEDLLDLTKIEAGALQLNRELVELVPLLEQVVALNRLVATPKQVTLRLRAELVGVRVHVDRVKLEQVLNNLLSNAINASPSQQTVEVRLRLDAAMATIAVHDRGRGIPPAKVAELFRPFAQIGSSEKSTGLGLAISRRIVEGHGGRIWAESGPHEGTTFYISLPREEAHP